MKYLTLLLIFNLIQICYAEEFTIDKEFNADQLAQEIETQTGLDIYKNIPSEPEPIGIIETKKNIITIKLKNRDLAADEKAKIEDCIKKHKPIDKKAVEKEKKNKAKAELKALGLKDETIEEIIK
ncbi:MAG: hypothetical protein FJ150_02690 [Euryarchaeota archaeon]|nr:hypothetical protein [Euryarchaeota archaeon]